MVRVETGTGQCGNRTDMYWSVVTEETGTGQGGNSRDCQVSGNSRDRYRSVW